MNARHHSERRPAHSSPQRGNAPYLLGSLLLGVAFPLGIYAVLGATGHDATAAVYALALACVLTDLALAMVAGLESMRIRRLPADASHPPASAIVLTDRGSAPAAVEASTHMLLGMPYRTPIQVVVACCTPEQEAAVAELRRHHAHRLQVIQIESDSPGDQLRAAVPAVRGQMAGIFRAGQIPFSNAYLRAWHWLARGCAAVGGGSLQYDRPPRGPELMETMDRVAAGIAPPFVYGPDDAPRGCVDGNIYLPTRLLQHLIVVDRFPRPSSGSGSHLADWRLLVRRRLRHEIDLHRTSIGTPRVRAADTPNSRRWFIPTRAMLAWHAAYAWLSPQVPIAAVLILWSHRHAGWLWPLAALLILHTLGTNIVRTALIRAASPPELDDHRLWFARYALLSAGVYRGLLHTLVRAAQLRVIALEPSVPVERVPRHAGGRALAPDGPWSEDDLARLKGWLLRVATHPANVQVIASIAGDAPAFARIVDAYSRGSATELQEPRQLAVTR